MEKTKFIWAVSWMRWATMDIDDGEKERRDTRGCRPFVLILALILWPRLDNQSPT